MGLAQGGGWECVLGLGGFWLWFVLKVWSLSCPYLSQSQEVELLQLCVCVCVCVCVCECECVCACVWVLFLCAVTHNNNNKKRKSLPNRNNTFCKITYGAQYDGYVFMKGYFYLGHTVTWSVSLNMHWFLNKHNTTTITLKYTAKLIVSSL